MIKNYQIFRETINSTIKNSGLDIGIVYFILKSIFIEIEHMYYAQINKELLEEAQQQQEEKEEEE